MKQFNGEREVPNPFMLGGVYTVQTGMKIMMKI